MNRILAIETATSSCSAALRVDGEIVVRSEIGNNIHSQVLLGMVESLLAEAQLSAQDLDAVAVGQGPGSFTGLRIGVGVGQGLAFGASCPMIGISSLDALAAQAQGDGTVIATIDARMGEVYWCEYGKEGAIVSRSGAPMVTPPARVCFTNREDGAKVKLVGNAWAVYPDDFGRLSSEETDRQDSIIYPCAGALLGLAEGQYLQRNWVSAAEFAPIYVRDDVAKKSTKPLPGRRPG